MQKKISKKNIEKLKVFLAKKEQENATNTKTGSKKAGNAGTGTQAN